MLNVKKNSIVFVTVVSFVMMILITCLCSCKSQNNANENLSDYDYIDKINCGVELNLHLDGAISVKSARELAAIENVSVPVSDEDLNEKMSAKYNNQDLNSFLGIFDFTCSLIQSKESLRKATINLLSELEEQGLAYVELRFAPQKSTSKGLTQEEAVQSVLEGMSQSSIKSNLILCIMRGAPKEINNETINVAEKYLNKGVCALDLAGSESLYKTSLYEDEFKLAKSKNIPFTIACGEADGPDSVWCALNFGSSRISHALRAVEDNNILEYLSENNISVEICPAIADYSTNNDIWDSSAKVFLDNDIIASINSSNPQIFQISYKEVLKSAAMSFSFSKDDTKRVLLHAIQSSFADSAVKDIITNQINSEFNNF